MKTKKLPEPKELTIQRDIFVWAELEARRYPELELLNASMNGAWIPGNMNQRFGTIKNLQKSGCLRKGFPDLNLPVACGSYHGLYIELKRKDGRVSQKQQWWLDRLTAQGYYAVPAWGYDQAVKIILEYLR